MTRYINCGTCELFIPFIKYLPNVKYLEVNANKIDLDGSEVKGNLVTENGKIVNVNKLANIKELNELAALWGENCFADWLSNVASRPVFDNMTGSQYHEMIR